MTGQATDDDRRAGQAGAAASAPNDTPPAVSAPAGQATRIGPLVKQSLPLVFACVVAFLLEHGALEMIGGRDHGSPLMQGLFSVQEVYRYAVSAWPRELVPRYTVLVHIDPDMDATATGLSNNVCLQREYLARLLPAIAERDPALIVIDKYFTRTGCTLPEPTAALQQAIASVGARLPVVVGLSVDERASAGEANRRLPPALVAPLGFPPSPSLREGIVNLDVMPRRIPLGWTVRYTADAKPEWRNGIALEAALVREPKLLAKAPRLQRLKDERDNPLTSMIEEGLFNVLQASDFLCTDKTTAPRFAQPCAHMQRSGADPTYLRGRIAVLGETGGSVDRHESTLIGNVAGTVLQANYVEALLDGRYFVPVPEWVDYLVGLLLFVALELALRPAGPWRVLVRVAVLLGLTFLLLALTARFLGYYVDPAVSVLVLVFLLIGWLRDSIGHTEKEKRDEKA